MSDLPPVIDVCCGSRMFWFDRLDDRCLFLDQRREVHELPDKSSSGGSRIVEIDPDLVGDFRELPFQDKSFSLVVFDPPHFARNGPSGWISKKYGTLGENWKEDLRKGFAECFRVLKSQGVLVFKWNEGEFSVSEVLKLTKEKPLFGNKYGKKFRSHWIVFMKGGDS